MIEIFVHLDSLKLFPASKKLEMFVRSNLSQREPGKIN